MPSTVNRPVLVDLFCGSGGATAGYQQAGFRVVGVDIAPQPRYIGDEFIQDNVMMLDLNELVRTTRAVAIHASPPCQAYSMLNAYNKRKYPDLIAPTRKLLLATRRPYVLENVPGAPLLEPVWLCGTMFELRVYRHRGFETTFPLAQPAHPRHAAQCARNGNLPTPAQFMTISGGKHSRAWQRAACEAMGVRWMAVPADATVERNRIGIREVCESIPPAMGKYIGQRLLTHLAGPAIAA